VSAFVIVKGATVWWPVRFPVPLDGGGASEAGFEMRFRRLGIAEFQALLERTVDDSLLTEIATDWRGITDDAGREVPFDAAGRAAMLDVPHVPAAIARAWQNCLAAVPETRLGNFGPSPGAGPERATAAADGAPPATPA
jgi:hypothetical protein